MLPWPHLLVGGAGAADTACAMNTSSTPQSPLAAPRACGTNDLDALLRSLRQIGGSEHRIIEIHIDAHSTQATVTFWKTASDDADTDGGLP